MHGTLLQTFDSPLKFNFSQQFRRNHD